MSNKIIKKILKLQLKYPKECIYFNERVNDAILNYNTKIFNVKVAHLYCHNSRVPNMLGKYLRDNYSIEILRSSLRNINNLKKIKN